MYSHITDIFFDLDHTLWDFDKNSEKAFELIFKNEFPDIVTSAFIAVYIPINQHCWKLYQQDRITHLELRYMRLKNSFDALGINISDEKIEKIAIDYIEYLPHFNDLFDNTIAVLDYLNKQYNLHIITNGFADVQTRKLHNANISHYFKSITNSEMANAKKPNPIIFEHALQLAGAKKNNSIMIGDCLDADINGALNFGIDALFFNPNQYASPKHVRQINNLIELKKIFSYD